MKKEVGDIDVLVNNGRIAATPLIHSLAGIVTGKSLFNNNEASIQRIMDVNTTSHFWTIREFVPAMMER